jgi:hypothetical protein
VNHLAARRGGSRRQIGLLAENHRQTPAGGVTGDAGAVDAAADDQKIDGIVEGQGYVSLDASGSVGSAPPDAVIGVLETDGIRLMLIWREQ